MSTALFVHYCEIELLKKEQPMNKISPCILDILERCDWIMISNKCKMKTIQIWIEFLNGANCCSVVEYIVAVCCTQLPTPVRYQSLMPITQLAEDFPNSFV